MGEEQITLIGELQGVISTSYRVYVHMYVCMYVRMYVHMYTCMYACMYVDANTHSVLNQTGLLHPSSTYVCAYSYEGT